jgi:hypothetical protein
VNKALSSFQKMEHGSLCAMGQAEAMGEAAATFSMIS